MKNLNIFIDGSWLYKACLPENVLASKTERPTKWFSIDFKKLNLAMLKHIQNTDPTCKAVGDAFLATSLFDLPEEFDEWPNSFPDFTTEDIERTKRGVHSRQFFAQNALDAGYSEQAIYRPRMKGYILKRLKEGRYQEKQVDTTVVALLVRSAITRSQDYHALITGDSDMIPAIKAAYPEYSRNVLIATTHPDELSADHRHTSFSLANFHFDVDAFFLQDHLKEIMYGDNVYECAHCHKVFSRPNPIPARARPCCFNCHQQRT